MLVVKDWFTLHCESAACSLCQLHFFTEIGKLSISVVSQSAAKVTATGNSKLSSKVEQSGLILACMHSSSDVKEGLAEFFIHLCHQAASAAISKLQCACKQEKRMPTHSTLV